MDVDLPKPSVSSESVIWFEFLLDHGLLQRHLENKNTDPSATNLIIQFLANASTTPVPDNSQSEIKPPNSENVATENGQEKDTPPTNLKKKMALEILALKTAAFLKWELEVLETKVPLHMQQILLQILVCVSMDTTIFDPTQHVSMNLFDVSDQALFALSIYHRWVLRAARNWHMPNKPIRQMFVSLPGQQNPAAVPPNVTDRIGQSLEAKAMESITVLENIIATNRAPLVPVFDTYVMLKEDTDYVMHNWKIGYCINEPEFLCQIHFDICSYYFFLQNYDLARQHVTSSLQLHHSLTQDLYYCTLDIGTLQGYAKACGVTIAGKSQLTLLQQYHQSVKNQFQGIVGILQEDNLKREIPMAYREVLEIDIFGAMSSGKFTVARDFLLQVQTLNVIRKVVEGDICVPDFGKQLKDETNNKAVRFLIKALKSVVKKATEFEKTQVCEFLFLLIDEIPKLRPIFEEEFHMLFISTGFLLPELDINFDEFKLDDWEKGILYDDSGKTEYEINDLEQHLIETFEPKTIEKLISKLTARDSGKQQWKVCPRWSLPIPIQSMVMNIPPGMLQDFCYILIAKVPELCNFHDYKEAKHLLQTVDTKAKNTTKEVGSNFNKFSRLLSWEILIVDIQQSLHEWPQKNGTEELVTKCKECISMTSGGEVIPRSVVMEYCAALLINAGEWDLLRGVNGRLSYLELTTLVANVCIEMGRANRNKKVIKDLWDMITPFYCITPSQKRSGNSSLARHDSPSSNLKHKEFSLFLSRLRNPVPINIFLSILSRMRNILIDDSTLEIYVDYLAVWPTVLTATNTYNSKLVSEDLQILLKQSLKYDPMEVSWLKATGDLSFVHSYYSASMKSYLEAGIVSSNYFSQVIPRNVLDDRVYRRMIKCCIQLQCYTKAAILCQFLEDVDYTTAFKCLQEKSCSDGMDKYYNCFWDVSILEFLICMHHKRGETEKKQAAMEVMSLLELNRNNNAEIQREAANIRKSRFMRSIAREYIG